MFSEGRPNLYTPRQYHLVMALHEANPGRSARMLAEEAKMGQTCDQCGGDGRVSGAPCRDCACTGVDYRKAENRIRTWIHMRKSGRIPVRYQTKSGPAG